MVFFKELALKLKGYVSNGVRKKYIFILLEHNFFGP